MKIVMGIAVVFGLYLTACDVNSVASSRTESAAEVASDQRATRANVVEIVARGMSFSAPDEIPSGWTTFRLKNQSGMVHFAAVQRLPEGITLADQQAEVAPVFQEGMDLLNAGDVDGAMQKFGALPAWFGDVVFMGGPGFVDGQDAAETTVFLEPGTYLVECYVKTNGVFHSYNPGGIGMVHQITVTDEDAGAVEPTSTMDLTISSTGGIEADSDVRPGRHIVAVHFGDQTVHEHFLGHDVHLARLEADTDLDALAAWMNWTLPQGLETPAPAQFVGGVNDMPAGSTAYVDVVLKPGRYAWIAEVPDPAGKNMMKIFDVPSQASSSRP